MRVCLKGKSKNMQKIFIENHGDYIHYYIDEHYLGMFVFSKGEISDHRAIIRKNKLKVTSENLLKFLNMSVYALLNHYLIEKEFIKVEELENQKSILVNSSRELLIEVTNKIIQNNFLQRIGK